MVRTPARPTFGSRYVTLCGFAFLCAFCVNSPPHSHYSRLSVAPAQNNLVAQVVIAHLTKLFAGASGESVRAVEDLSLVVEDREFLVLVGPSGCGKTTTLRLIAGLEEPTQGTISIGGRPVTNLPPKERDVAMVFQNPALYPHLSAYDNMAFGLTLRKCPKAEIQRRVVEAAELLDLNGCLPRRPHELSGGQRQRVAIGRAIVRRPALFLFDEPLSNLDAPLRAQMREEIARLHTQLGASMVYVTHDQVEAMTLGDRVAVLQAGVLQQVGPPVELYRRPANPFVASFIGSLPMNFCS
jgi:multiple sugar transport system ATP-binding protein